MSSPNECVEVVEVTWKIPNFRDVISSDRLKTMRRYRKVVDIGGRVPPAYPQSLSPPVKLEVLIIWSDPQGWRLWLIVLSDTKNPLPPAALQRRLMELKTFDSNGGLLKGTTVVMMPTTLLINGGTDKDNQLLALVANQLLALVAKQRGLPLFQNSDAESYVDKGDGSLNIYFKMEITRTIAQLNTENMMTAEFAELANDFESLLKDPRNADVEIKVFEGAGEGEGFRCHKVILAVRSPIFRAMFESDMKETQENVVDVYDILPKTMGHFISFLYCRRFQDSSWMESLPQLAYAADKYDVKSLKNLCDSNLLLIVTLENALTLVKLAERHGPASAERNIRNFIGENVQKVTLEMDLDLNTSNSDPNLKVSYSTPPPP